MKARRFVLMGHPVRHSLSSTMFGAAFKAAGLPHTYTSIDVPSASDLARLANEIRSGLLSGANVTLPHKKRVLDLVDARTPAAEAAQAANVLYLDPRGQLVGHNTDVGALVAELGALSSARSRAAVLGSGGAAAAAIVACKELGFKVVGVASRSWLDTQATHENDAARLVRQLGALACPWPSQDRAVPSSKFSAALRLQWTELAVQADLIIQATSAGALGGDDGSEIARLVPFAKLPKHAAAFDVVYRPPLTPFLLEATKHGMAVRNGLGMLVHQAEATYVEWIGAPPPAGVMRAAAESALGGAIA
jgi:shikimate dehydrogenase